MNWSFIFFFNSILLGAGLAMDAFSVSMANGLNDPKMSKKRMLCIAGTFAAFQAFMPMTGWICVHTIVEYFSAFEKFIPLDRPDPAGLYRRRHAAQRYPSQKIRMRFPTPG